MSWVRIDARRAWAIASVTLVLASGCSRQGAEQGAREEITAQGARLSRSYSGGWADSIAAVFATDGRQIPPNGPSVTGREKIRAYWAEALSWGRWVYRYRAESLDVSGLHAIERGRYEHEFEPNLLAVPGMGPMEEAGSYVFHWRADGGRWLLAVDISTLGRATLAGTANWISGRGLSKRRAAGDMMASLGFDRPLDAELDFGAFDVLTFDCYGTLIDWESGILRSIRRVLEAHDRHAPSKEILVRFARLESDVQAGPYLPYREILSEVDEGFGRELDFRPSREERSALAESVAAWSPFGDTVPALNALRSRYRLAVISNVDDDLFAGSARQLGVDFDQVVTAQQVGSYKPALRNFRIAFDRLGVPADRILHVAQSLFHDVAPANRLGLSSVWVNRRSGRAGPGATSPAEARPSVEVPDLATLADLATRRNPSPDSSGASTGATHD